MKEKNNVLLMVITVMVLIATVAGATFAYFASTITPGEGLNLDVTAEASTAQFTATGGNFGFTVTGADMQQNKVGTFKTGFGVLYIDISSEKVVTCTYDIKFEWDTGSSYTPTKSLSADELEFAVSAHWISGPSGTCSEGTNNIVNLTNFDKITKSSNEGGYDGIVIKNASASATEDYKIGGCEYDFNIYMYNLSHDQSALAGNGTKTYSGRFYVDNVVC